MKIVTLGGRNTLEQVAAVARYGAVVEFSAKYIERVKICRQHVERFSREGKLFTVSPRVWVTTAGNLFLRRSVLRSRETTF